MHMSFVTRKPILDHPAYQLTQHATTVSAGAALHLGKPLFMRSGRSAASTGGLHAPAAAAPTVTDTP